MSHVFLLFSTCYIVVDGVDERRLNVEVMEVEVEVRVMKVEVEKVEQNEM